MGVLDKVLPFLVFFHYVDLALVNQQVETVDAPALDSVENGALSVVVRVVGVCPMFYKNFHYIQEPFACSVENWSLTVRINMVRITSVFQEESDHV